MKGSQSASPAIDGPCDTVYLEVARLTQKLGSEMLARMIEQSESYPHWNLSDWDRTCLIRLIRENKSLMCATFSAQLKAYFGEFRREIKAPKTMGWHGQGSESVIENERLREIAQQHQKSFKTITRNILKRLQTCVHRSRASAHENPIQINRFCEAFQITTHKLNLQLEYRLALYNLFSDHVIGVLNPLYQRIDRVLQSRGMLPDPGTRPYSRNRHAVRSVDPAKSRQSRPDPHTISKVRKKLDRLTRPLRDHGVSDLIFEKVWLPLLVQIAQHQGCASNTWHETIRMIKKQVWAMTPKSTRADQTQLIRILPEVEFSLRRAMRSLNLTPSLQRSLSGFFKLERQHVVHKTAENLTKTKAEKPQNKKRATDPDHVSNNTHEPNHFDEMMQTGRFMVMTDTITAIKASQAQAPPPTIAPRSRRISTRLTRGEWISITQEDNHILAKLAWKADDNSWFIFVDRGGKRVCELDAKTLEHRFTRGAMSRMDSSGTSVNAKKYRNSFMTQLG